jgi:hypothetical protein
MDFGLGGTIAARRHVLDRIGVLRSFRGYLAKDSLIGNIAHKLGYGVILPSGVVDCGLVD